MNSAPNCYALKTICTCTILPCVCHSTLCLKNSESQFNWVYWYTKYESLGLCQMVHISSCYLPVPKEMTSNSLYYIALTQWKLTICSCATYIQLCIYATFSMIWRVHQISPIAMLSETLKATVVTNMICWRILRNLWIWYFSCVLHNIKYQCIVTDQVEHVLSDHILVTAKEMWEVGVSRLALNLLMISVILNDLLVESDYSMPECGHLQLILS